jgi:acyl carrier protein
VREVVVVTQTPAAGQPRLAAFLVQDRFNPPSLLSIRAELERRLPGGGVPASLAAIDAFPLTADGNVDRVALQQRTFAARPDSGAPFRGAESELERRLVVLWADLMEVAEVGVDDDFFELGGNSLIGMRIAQEVADTYGVAISPRSFYSQPTIAGLADLVLAERSQK